MEKEIEVVINLKNYLKVRIRRRYFCFEEDHLSQKLNCQPEELLRLILHLVRLGAVDCWIDESTDIATVAIVLAAKPIAKEEKARVETIMEDVGRMILGVPTGIQVAVSANVLGCQRPRGQPKRCGIKICKTV